jgi:hypothetical protein
MFMYIFRSVGIVRSRTKATELVSYVYIYLNLNMLTHVSFYM